MTNPGNSASEQISDELVDIVHQREAAPAVGAVAAVDAAVELLEETPAEEREEVMEKMRGKLAPIIGEQPQPVDSSKVESPGLMTASEERVTEGLASRLEKLGVDVNKERLARRIRARRSL